MHTHKRYSLIVGGQVQGVGFRPFVYRCAVEHGLTGSVGNTSEGVEIQVQGPAKGLNAFLADFENQLPPLAQVTSCTRREIPLTQGEDRFVITHSGATGGGHTVLVSPDVALCPQCQADMDDPLNRRYLYPFTNCTDCGPRYTITRAIPYDRSSTSMACFPLCPTCHAEYTDPLNRRFHAQPNACPLCGPRLWAVEGHKGEEENSHAYGEKQGTDSTQTVQTIATALQQGRIAAIKGLGGFQLACDAFNAKAIALLRVRKHRPHKALAIMVPDMARARLVAELSPAHEALLRSAEAPIVVCPQKAGILPQGIAPDGHNVGLMLPYTPLHKVLFALFASADRSQPAGLVMTSGNAGGEPICLGNREALQRLRDIADIFLLHNRDILVRADDSVVAVVPETSQPLLYRRARGYVPRPLPLPAYAGASQEPCVVGMGAALKATLCFTRGNAAFVSQHVGDLQNLETWQFYQEVATHLEHLLEVRPAALVCDLHPDYMSTLCAYEWAQEKALPLLRLQHHAAHAWSVLAENGYEGSALVWTLDGTGLGTQGPLGLEQNQDCRTGTPEIWGGELLRIDTAQGTQTRVGSLSTFPLPGGDAAVREPWRVAQGMLALLGKTWTWPAPHAKAATIITHMVRQKLHCPPTSSVGRLFDAVAALLGLCLVTSYEGQAALRLQEAQDTEKSDSRYAIRLLAPTHDSLWRMDSLHLFGQIYEECLQGVPVGRIARKFHYSLAQGLADMAACVAREQALQYVGLSGGVMQNPTLVAILPSLLTQHGLQPLLHKALPPNDGCIAFGQAAFGRAWLKNN
ncbi:MAG: carbamoyltransferase HypF [Desulfovibrionaceae bacterium]